MAQLSTSLFLFLSQNSMYLFEFMIWFRFISNQMNNE